MSKENSIKQDFLDDAKTIFDGLKNLGVSAAIALGLQWFQVSMAESDLSHNFKVFVNWLGVALSILLTSLTLYWVGMSLKVKPANRIFNMFSLAVLGLIAATIMSTVICSTTKKVPMNFEAVHADGMIIKLLLDVLRFGCG